MALTERQAQATMNMFLMAFVSADNEKDRIRIYFEFEDVFGPGIADWKNMCKEKLVQETTDREIIEHFNRLSYRKKIENEK